MATIPVPHQFTSGEYPTAANLNTGAYTGVNFLIGGSAGQKPSFQVHVATAVQVATVTSTTLKYDTVDRDTDSAYSTSTGVYTLTTSGLWLFTVNMQWASNSTGYRYIQALLGGTNFYSPAQNSTAPFTTAPQILTVGPFYVTSGTACSVQVYQNSGATLATSTGNNVLFSGVWLGA